MSEMTVTPLARKKTSRLLMIAGVSLAVGSGLLLSGCSDLNNVNAGGSSQTAKVANMVLTANLAPEGDWQVLSRSNPKVDNSCVSTETAPCLTLDASWSVNYPVKASEIGRRMGLSMGNAEESGLSSDCVSVTTKEETGNTEICVSDSNTQSGAFQVDLSMTQR